MKQNELVNYLKKTFENIKGVRALYLKGSLARDEGDEYSDVDFYCLVTKNEYENVKTIREEKLLGYNDIYFIEEVNFGIEQLVVLFSNNLHLDFYITKDAPAEGTDDIKAIYDPESIVNEYVRKERVDSFDIVLDSLNQSIYTFSEVDAAIKRGDTMWSIRLLSHILAKLSTPLSYLYDKESPVIHMKRLYNALPKDLSYDVDVIMRLMVPETQLECALKLIELDEKIIEILGEEFSSKLPIRYLKLMKQNLANGLNEV